MAKIIKKAYHLFLLFFDLILLLYISIILSVQIPAVQNILAKQLTSALSDQLKCHISIKKVKLDFLSRIVLSSVYIEDQAGDSLLYAYEIDLSYQLRPLLEKKIRIDGLCLYDAFIQLRKPEGSEVLNAAFLFDSFKSSDTTTTVIDLALRELEIVNGRFIFEDENEEKKKYGFDPWNINLSALNLFIADFSFDGDNLIAQELEVSVEASSGAFVLERLSGAAEIGSKGIHLHNMKLKTSRSEAYGEFAMLTNEWSDYSDFFKKVRFDSDFLPSKIDMRDISYFAPDLKGMENAPSFSGQVKGSLSKLKGKNIELSIDNHTYLELAFELNGLPDVRETFFYFDIEKLKSSKYGAEQISLPSSGKTLRLALPSELEKLGQVSYKGFISGYLSDLVAYGHLSSDLGELYTDISLKQGDQLEYSGYVKTDDLKVGRLIDSESELKSISLEAKIKGSGIDEKHFNARIDGHIDKIELKSYTFREIDIAGDMSAKEFTGDIKVNDKNLKLDFIGNIDLSDKEKQFNFIAEVEHFRPYYILKTDQFDSLASISSTVNIDVIARDIDSLIGQLDVFNTYYTDSKDTVTVNKINFKSNREGQQKEMSLRSDIADFNIVGKFDMIDNFQTMRSVLQRYLDHLVTDTIEIDKHFEFDAEIKDFSLINAFVTPDLWLDSNSTIHGVFNSSANKLEVKTRLIGFKDKNIKIDTSFIDLTTNPDHLGLSAEFLIHKKGKKRRRITLLSSAKDNVITSEMQSRGGGSFATDFKFNSVILDHNTVDFQIVDSRFLLGDSIWYFDNENKITYDSSAVLVENLRIYKNDAFIKIDGTLSKNPSDTLSLETSDFNLVVLNPFLEGFNIKVAGIVNGKASVKDLYNNPLFESNLNFRDLNFNSKLIGSGDIKSLWNTEEKRLDVDGYFNRSDTNTFSVKGYFDTKDEVSPLHFDVKMAYMPLVAFEPFTKGILSDFKGLAGAALKLRGSVSEPLLTGKMGILGAGAHIDYLNTSYFFKNYENEQAILPIIFKVDTIQIPRFTLVDRYGKKGLASFTFVHQGFKKNILGIRVVADKLFVLNTNSFQNDLYYGKVFVSGNIVIGMKEGMTRVKMDISTESGTKFSLPLQSSTEVIENEFVVFAKNKEQLAEERNAEEEEKVKPLNIEVNLKVKSKPGAQMRIVFDEAIGDVLRAEGTGDMEITFNQKDGLNLKGEYVIESGDYLFTLESLISKRFYIEQGSSIKWNGSPFKGLMDITTNYKLRAKLKNIIPDIYDDVNYERMTPIELRLKMSGLVEAPDIGFDINLPATNENGRGQLRSALSTENCLNQQVFSLLILNSFTQCEVFGEDVNYAVGKSTAYEAMSNQLSKWLSKISDNVDVGFTYRPEFSGQEGEQISPEQVEVALSTQLFDDRLILDGNVGYGDQSVNSTEKSSDVVGEFTIEYKIRPDGRLRVKAFNHVNDRSYIENDNLYVQGVGLSYSREYSKFGELMREMFGKKEKETSAEE